MSKCKSYPIVSLVALAASCAAVSGAHAQKSFPGIVISAPPAQPAAPAAPAKPKALPKRKAKPKPKARSARRTPPRRSRSTRRGTGSGTGSEAARTRISLLVNDTPITNYEITERAKLMALSGPVGKRAQQNFKALVANPRTNQRLKKILKETIDSHRGQPRSVILAAFERRKKAFARSLQQRAVRSARSSLVAGMRRKAREELIDERLKVQEAKRLGIVVSDERVASVFAGVAKRNNQSPKAFAAHLSRAGASAGTMKARFRADIAWNSVLRRRFGRLVSVSQRDIDEFVDQQDSGGDTRLRLQRITLSVPDILDQGNVARRLSEGDTLRRGFRNCSNSRGLASQYTGAKFEDLGNRDPNKLAEPVRSMLLSANTNEMLPPTLGKRGVEVYIVCGKTKAGDTFEMRDRAEQELQRKEMEIWGKRHLADLRRDAHIEKR